MKKEQLNEKQITWLKQVTTFQEVQRNLMPLVKARRLTLKDVADMAPIWAELHGREITPWDCYQTTQPTLQPQYGIQQTYTLNEIETIVSTPKQYMDAAMTRRAIETQLSEEHVRIYNILADLQPHTGKEILAITMDGDYRRKITSIRRLLEGRDPKKPKGSTQINNPSIYEIPENEPHKDGVYQLKQRI